MSIVTALSTYGAPMTKLLLSAVVLLVVAGCGSDEPPPEDARACELYEEAVAAADAGEGTDEELLDRLEEAWLAAGSDRMDDLLDDLLGHFEDPDRDPEELRELTVPIRVRCGMD